MRVLQDEREVAGMPDVTRSDSQRSDTSLRPRVSFNRDVHVKRIVPRESSRVVGALNADGAGHLVASPVRKERRVKSKQQLAEEAARVLHQADKIDCVSQDKGVLPEKFYTLPARKKNKVTADYPQTSLDRRIRRRNSEEISSDIPPKKPPRTFVSYSSPQKPSKNSIFNIFKKSDKEPNKKSNLKRSVSDASNLKSKAYGPTNDIQTFKKRSGSDTEENLSNIKGSKKLSPIIEVTPREDYFSESNKDKENVYIDENIKNVENQRKVNTESVTEKLREYIDEVDNALYEETGIRVNSPTKEKQKEPEVVIIDVDKAKKISCNKNNKKSKLTTGIISKKIKSFTSKKNKISKVNTAKTKSKSLNNQNNKNVSKKAVKDSDSDDIKIQLREEPRSPAPKIKEAIESLENQAKHSPKMIHSSQKPPEKLPLTRGRTVDNIVKRLSSDKCSPPPKTSIMITPNVTVQHNNNQPFSYTRGLSPEKTYDESRSPPNLGSPVIYAQVVCGNGGPNGTTPTKQTIHTAYTYGKKHLPHSDSDEGLGYEENSGYSRKYETDKNKNGFVRTRDDDFYNDIDRFDEEFPITPKFKPNGYANGYSGYDRKYSEYSKTDRNFFIDSSSRGRGDGMDSKRRESLTEPYENGFSTTTKLNGTNGNINGRSDLSARRDLLESRINRRFGDKTLRQSPEYTSKSPSTNVYVSETTSKYYRSGSTSPIGYKEKYLSETKVDKNGEPHTVESRNVKYFGDNNYENNRYKYNSYENEPKSFDSQISDYRSSPENRHFESSHNYKTTDYNTKYISKTEKQQIFKNKGYYKSNPEIHQRSYDDRGRYEEESYHDSLRRDKHDKKINNSSGYRNERYLDQNECERKEKFVDSGIENDFRRDSGENYRTSRQNLQKREFSNESEDEGFASSLLIASERQHTEDNLKTRKQRRDYDSDRGYPREDKDESYRIIDKETRQDYAHRERSIDDGSHYDPRIDKNLDKDQGTLKKFSDKKPPKPEKKSSLEKMKQLFSRDSKKHKKDKQGMVREESLRARYTEYRGSRENLEPKIKRKEVNEINAINNRRRLSTPSPSPTRDTPQRNGKSYENTNSSWFKSLDRLSRKKSKKGEKESNLTSAEEEPPTKPTPTKNLRFFGDTDVESNDSIRQKSSMKTRSGINRDRVRSQSSRDLHNITEEMGSPTLDVRKTNHKSMLNISESEKDVKDSRLSLKPPMSPNHRTNRDTSRAGNDRGRRRKNEVSSVESSTEGDSSQQSQRSVVYLHAATVGDIPGPGMRNGRRAASREELTSNGSSRIQPQVKTLSRSFSVLAPWRPRHYRESMDIDYTQYPKPTKNSKYEQKVTKNGTSRKENSSTLKKKAQETRRSNQNISTLNRKSRSKENISSQTLKRSKEEMTKGSSSTLYKKNERQPKENTRYNRDREEKKMSAKSMSVESLGGHGRLNKNKENGREISRSISMPRDPEKTAGWFKMSKKSKKSVSSQRL